MTTYHLLDPAVGMVLLAGGILALAAYGLYQLWQRRGPDLSSRFPVLGDPDEKDLRPALLEGFRTYPDTPFVIPTTPPRLMLPMRYLSEVAYAPENHMSLNADVYDTFQGRYTSLGTKRDEVILSVRGDLTKSIGNILPMLQEEARYGFNKEIGNPTEWTTVTLYSKLLRIVALLSGRIFVGLPLSRDEEWIKMSVEYTLDVGAIQKRFMTMNPMLRPIVAPFTSSVRKAVRDLNKAKKWMEPLVREAMTSAHDHEKHAPIKAGTRATFISWMLSHLPENIRTVKRITENQMLITFAAIHTTTMTSTMVLCDLASRPEYIQALREEAEQVLRDCGDEGVDDRGRPYYSKTTISKMKLLDSFIKESQRLNPLGFASVARRLQKDITFSDGLTLPKGTRIAFPTWGVYQSDAMVGGATGNPGPEVFDGFRFARMREQPGKEAKHQTVTIAPDSLNFGQGTHACPGRFFAIYEIKTMVLEFLREYDFKMAGDVDGVGGEKWHPKVAINQLNSMPNTGAKLEIRKRQA